MRRGATFPISSLGDRYWWINPLLRRITEEGNRGHWGTGALHGRSDLTEWRPARLLWGKEEIECGTLFRLLALLPLFSISLKTCHSPLLPASPPFLICFKTYFEFWKKNYDPTSFLQIQGEPHPVQPNRHSPMPQTLCDTASIILISVNKNNCT